MYKRQKKSYLKQLQNKISNYGIEDKITITGSRNDISNIYKISDFVFNLSIKPEPFGRTTIEAISSGSKVIGWNHGGTKEILEELYPDGLVELDNIDDLAEKVINLSNMTNNMPKENIFTSESMTNQTISLYQDLLAKRL